MKLVAINDIHKTSVAPRSRTADYNEQINAKLLEVVSFCNEYSVDFLLITGDFFHSINIENTPYWQCGEAANILIKCKCPIIAALGNHDWDEVPQRLPYFPIFYAYKAAKVYFKPVSGRVDIASKWNDLYEFVVINSNDGSNLDDAWDVVNKLGPTERTRIIVYHGPIVPPSFASTYPTKFMEKAIRLQDLNGIGDFVFYGDIHDPHSVTETSNTTFVNYGSLSRNSAKELHNIRPVYLAYAEFDDASGDAKIQPVELECVVPAEQAFRTAEILEEKEHDTKVETFVESLGTTTFPVLTPDILIDRIEKEESLMESERNIAVSVIRKITG